MYRTHSCAELRTPHAGKEVTLAGWVHTRRDHGGLIFLDLRDASGIVQVRFDPKSDAAAWEVANTVRSEFVLKVTGKVVDRPNEMRNPKLATGDIEVNGRTIEILNKAKTTPFPINQEGQVGEEVRLKYRYLDLRRPSVQHKLRFRGELVAYFRRFFIERGFTEIETPILGKSTPEGARDYLVPSRLHPGKFYALPQSPQQYKQLLMVGGFEKYFQIAPCFRDEDGRADRAPDQFYQLDLEMAFVEQEDILQLIEELCTSFVEEHTKKQILTKPWPRMRYDEAMEKYGTDRPDIRFGCTLHDVTALAQTSDFSVFKNAATVKGFAAPGAGKFSRKEMDELTIFVQSKGAKGLAWVKVKGKEFDSPIAKFFNANLQSEVIQSFAAQDGDAIFFVADEVDTAQTALGELRVHVAEKLQLADPKVLAFTYVVDFPLFEPKLVDGHCAPSHHMFTRPKEDNIALLDADPLKVRSWQHDLVLNGVEVAGGSLRIYQRDLQEKIFSLIGFDLGKAREEFRHMLEAFEFGAPPHGGIAAGIDRLLMILLDEANVREVVAFPKTGDNLDLTLGAPSAVDPKQLRDLRISIAKK